MLELELVDKRWDGPVHKCYPLKGGNNKYYAADYIFPSPCFCPTQLGCKEVQSSYKGGNAVEAYHNNGCTCHYLVANSVDAYLQENDLW